MFQRMFLAFTVISDKAGSGKAVILWLFVDLGELSFELNKPDMCAKSTHGATPQPRSIRGQRKRMPAGSCISAQSAD
jgi:hypothetical protein